MILKQMVEDVLQEFPNYTRTQIVFELNRAMREFCKRTGIYYGVTVRNRADHLVSEDNTTPLTIYSLPSNVYEVNGIDELIRDIYEVRDDELYIDLVDSDLDELTIRYTALPVPMSSEYEEPPFDSAFHEVLICMTKKRLYSKAQNVQMAGVEAAYVREYEREARRYVNTMPYRNTGAFAGSDMTTLVAWGSQVLVQGENTIVLGKTFSSVDSFSVMLNGNGIDVEEYDPNDNHDQRTTSTIKVYSADANTNFEFVAVGT